MKEVTRWYSPNVGTEVTVARWGHYGTPVLIFPTAGGDAEEAERFKMVDVLWGLIDSGRIKLFSCDSVAGRAWSSNEPPLHCAWMQNQFDTFVYRELVPAIRADCGGEPVEIVTAGASIGAFNALASICRHPDVFSKAICMSGTYDMQPWLHGQWSDDFYFSSPMHFLPNLGESEQLSMLRRRFILLPTGEGQWEEPSQSWRMAEVLGTKGIPNRVDPWGPEWDHDWPTWREMLPKYLAEMA
jgi:esterase/lipase superfamily enzyme